jgi:hypothetical protein
VTPQDVEIQLLIAEKERADKQVDAFMDLQMKLLGTTVLALAAAGSWIFSQKGPDPISNTTVAVACLIGSFLLSAALLQTVVTYGISLGYTYYKNERIGPALARYCHSNTNPLLASESWRESPSRRPVILAAGLLFLLCVSASFVLALIAINHAEGWALLIAADMALLVAALVVLCLAWNMRAMRRIVLSPSAMKSAVASETETTSAKSPVP